MDSPNSMRNNTYLLTLQANCATISQTRKHTKPTRPDYFLFLREIQAKVLTKSQQAIYFKTKTNDHVGNGPLSLLLCLESVESVCVMWKTLPINLFGLFWCGAQLLGARWPAATEILSLRKRENPGNVVVLRDLPIVGFVKYLKAILFYRSDTTRSLRPVPLWLRKPFSRISYSLDWMHSKTWI